MCEHTYVVRLLIDIIEFQYCVQAVCGTEFNAHFALSADKDVGNKIIAVNILCDHSSSNSFQKFVHAVNTSKIICAQRNSKSKTVLECRLEHKLVESDKMMNTFNICTTHTKRR